MSEPAYTRMQVDERREHLLEVGAQLFTDHAFEELSMRQIAEAAGVSKALLYHYFPSKLELFKAAWTERAEELQRLIEPSGEGSAADQLTASLDAYLGWIEENARTWVKLMQSANVPEARELLEEFRELTMSRVLQEISETPTPPPALRIALRGWLGYMDAAILDWASAQDLEREQLRNLLLAAFAGALMTAQQTDPAVRLRLF